MLPPPALVEVIDAPRKPEVDIDPTDTYLFLARRPALPPLAELARPELRLAGIRFDPLLGSESRQAYFVGLQLLHIASGTVFPVKGLPAEPRIRSLRWSPDGRYLAFLQAEEDGQFLYVVEVARRMARRLPLRRLNTIWGTEYTWYPDSRSLLVKTEPPKRGAPPPAPRVPLGPNVQEASGRAAPAKTYQDLLTTPHDEDLFEYHLTTVLRRVWLDGRSEVLGPPAMYGLASPSPDGRALLVSYLQRPFSYLVPAERFPRRVEVRDARGKFLRTIAELSLAEEVPVAFDAVRTGPREYAWREDLPATLWWAEAQDGGDPSVAADPRDVVFVLASPFEGEPQRYLQTALRFSDLRWSLEGFALLSEARWKDRRTITHLVDTTAHPPATSVLFDRSWEDRYHDPGRPQMTLTTKGQWVLQTDEQGTCLYLRGAGASPEGDRPFLDRLDLKSRKSERLFHSTPPRYEVPQGILAGDPSSVLLSRESPSEPPNYFLLDRRDGSTRQLTFFPHPTPKLAAVTKELIRYQRKDGVDLTATLYLPPGHDPSSDGPLPLLMWAYPQEFKSRAAAGQVTDSPHRFLYLGWWSPLIWLAHGYAVLDDPSMPIVGEGEVEPNDTYVSQLVAGAEAAVTEVVRRGVTTRERIAVGGHSYGAFMVANLLAHTQLFKAGIARSGAYNRTLTPFGFQAEERTLWQARETYAAMSPFFHAERIDEPILFLHGEADENTGTYPLQSERLFEAIKGLGGTARLVLLPLEGHGYRSRETILHVAWETATWLDRYLAPNSRSKPGE